MTCELLLHIEEDMDDSQREDLLLSLGNRPGFVEPHLQSSKPHMMFVAYDPEQLCPHDIVEMAGERGFHAHSIDL